MLKGSISCRMTRKRFFSLLFLLSLFFVFLKIYQHNLLIKLNFEKQRLERKKLKLKDRKSLLLVEVFKLKDFKRVQRIAQEELGLQELKLSQIKRVSDYKKSFYSDISNV